MTGPRVLILTDGKIGDLVQCRGVARHLTSGDRVAECLIEPGWFWSLPLPFMPVRPADRTGSTNSPFSEPFPDIILASGRRTIPYLREFKRRGRSFAERPMLVFLKDPRSGRNAADFIWAPVHDRMSGENVISTHTSPHGLDEERMKDASEIANQRFSDCPAPLTGLVLGGVSGSVKWGNQSCEDFAGKLRQLPKEGSVLITPSRRTPENLAEAVKAALQNHTFFYWDGDGENPYLQILARVDRLIVTGDSHNMVSEALSTGRPVHIYRPEGLQKKLHAFLDAMAGMEAIREFDPELPDFTPQKFDATQEIAIAILEKFQKT